MKWGYWIFVGNIDWGTHCLIIFESHRNQSTVVETKRQVEFANKVCTLLAKRLHTKVLKPRSSIEYLWNMRLDADLWYTEVDDKTPEDIVNEIIESGIKRGVVSSNGFIGLCDHYEPILEMLKTYFFRRRCGCKFILITTEFFREYCDTIRNNPKYEERYIFEPEEPVFEDEVQYLITEKVYADSGEVYYTPCSSKCMLGELL